MLQALTIKTLTLSTLTIQLKDQKFGKRSFTF